MASEAVSDNGKFSDSSICKGAISTIMGRDPAIIRVDKLSQPVVFLSYVWADDNTRWSYRCKLEGSRIFWATPDGRWRTHEADEVITFEVVKNTISIRQKFADGSESEDNYSLSQLSGE